MSSCVITPIEAFQSTNLNSKIDSFGRLADRIVRSIGAPLVSVESHQDQIFENIAIACEMFSKYAGYTKEYLILDSNLYERGKGIRLDYLYTLSNGNMNISDKVKHRTESPDTAPYLQNPENVFVTSCPISYTIFSKISNLSGIFVNGLVKNQILDKTTYDILNNSIKLSSYFIDYPYTYTVITNYHTAQNPIPSLVFSGSPTLSSKYNNGINYGIDILDNTDYSEISSYLVNYSLSNFFNSILTTYNTGSAKVLNDIPLSIFLNNSVLSSIITKKLSTNEIISDSFYTPIKNNLSQITIGDYFDLTHLSAYSITLALSNNVFKGYPELRDVFTTNFEVDDSISKSNIDLIESTIGAGFPLSTFILNPHSIQDGTVVNPLTGYLTISELPSAVFTESPVLSVIYDHGISVNTLLTNTEYDILTSNLDITYLAKFTKNVNTLDDITILDYVNEGPGLDGSGYLIQVINKLIDIQSNLDEIYSIMLNYPSTLSLVNYPTLSGNLYNNLFTMHQVTVSGNNYNTFNYISGSSDTNTYSYKLSYEQNVNTIPLVKYYNLGLSGFYTSFDGSGNGIVDPSFNDIPTLTSWWTTNYDTISTGLENELFRIEFYMVLNAMKKYDDCIVTTSISGEVLDSVYLLAGEYGTAALNGLHEGYIIKDFSVPLIDTNGGISISAFFHKTELTIPNYITMYDVDNSISTTLMMNNSALSGQYGSGILSGSVLSASEYDFILLNQPNIPFSNNYHLSSITDIHTCNTTILSNIWLPYPTLSTTYSNGLNVGRVLYPNEYSSISTETTGYFNASTYFSDISSNRYVYTNTNVLCSNLFSNSQVLSSIYPNGINVGQSMFINEYGFLSSNFDDTITNFYKPKYVSYIHAVQYHKTIESIPKSVFNNTSLSSVYPEGVDINVNITQNDYNNIINTIEYPLKSYVCESYVQGVTNSCENECSKISSKNYNNMFDYDIMDYRKVVAVTNFEEGATTGVNTLFTIEQTLAQQTYFSYAMGNYGFDLISWYTVKNWLETREKVLATKRSFEFNDRTQYLRIYPEPNDSVRFYGVLDCYIEKPIRDLIKEQWVYKYALALTKIGVGYVRGKFSGVNIFGGQAWAADIKSDGITERDKLEEQLYTNAAGLGDSEPACMFIG